MSMNIRDAVRRYGSEYLAACGYYKYFPVMNLESSVFWVDWSGDDTNEGQTPDAPLLTITAALGKCTAEKNDYIFVRRHYQASGETWPIAVNKTAVHLIGLNDGSPINPGPVLMPATASKQSLDITVGQCEIANMEFNGYSASYSAININTSGKWGNWIHDCQFCTEVQAGAALHGIDVLVGKEMLYGVVERCHFGIGIASNGIEVSSSGGGVRHMIIRDNHFRVSGIGINVGNVAADFKGGGIYNNTFIPSADTKGYGILLAAGVTGGCVDGNHFGSLEGDANACAAKLIAQNTTFGPSFGLNWQSDAVIDWPDVT